MNYLFEVGETYNNHRIERRTKSSVWVNKKRVVITTMKDGNDLVELSSVHSDINIDARRDFIKQQPQQPTRAKR